MTERKRSLQAMGYCIIQGTVATVKAMIERDGSGSPSFDSAEALRDMVLVQQEYNRKYRT